MAAYCVPGAMLACSMFLLNLLPFPLHSKDTEAQRGEVPCLGPHRQTPVLCPLSTGCPLAVHLHLALQPAGESENKKSPCWMVRLQLEANTEEDFFTHSTEMVPTLYQVPH